MWAALMVLVSRGFLAPAGIPVERDSTECVVIHSFDCAGTVAISLIVTALFNASRGSILLLCIDACSAHAILFWPDAQPYDTFFFVAAAVLVVWINRKAMFSRERAVMEVTQN